MRSHANRLSLFPLVVAMAAYYGCKKPPVSPVVEKPVPSEVVRWVHDNAIPLRCCGPACGTDDLLPLNKVIGDARVVAVGEATHGTSEFFQFKHKLLQYLVEEKGFTVFGIEASFAEALVINRYVLTGEGTPSAGLTGLHFWTWDTQEVLQMIQWMRLYNSNPAHKEKVSFYGFDMQFTKVAFDDVLGFFAKVAREKVEPLKKTLYLVNDSSSHLRISNASDVERSNCTKGIQSMLDDLRVHKEVYIRKSNASDWELAVQEATVLQQAVSCFTPQSGTMVRDKAMADNILWILRREGSQAKMMVWAHNGHVCFGSDESGGPKTRMYKPMGAYLKDKLGDGLLVFGFTFDQGSFNAIDRGSLNRGKTLRQFSVGPSPEGTIPSALSRVGIKNFILDFRALSHSGPVWEWWQTPHWYRSFGAVYFDGADTSYFGWAQSNITKDYDALVFFSSTTAAHPTATGMRPQTAKESK